MPIKLIPDCWETPRLKVKDSQQQDVAELQEAYDQAAYIKPWTGQSSGRKNTMRSALIEGDLPPGGSKEFFRLQSVRLKASGELTGFLEMYHGYPIPDVFWVGLLLISPMFQKEGYGRERVNSLKELLRSLGGYQGIRLGVALKNWPAIRFWKCVGLDRIVMVKGDDVCSATTFAFLILECSLSASG